METPNSLALIAARRATWETEYCALTALATTLARASARSVGERDAQLQLLRDYDDRRRELSIKMACADELASVIVAATPVTPSPLTVVTTVAVTPGVTSAA